MSALSISEQALCSSDIPLPVVITVSSVVLTVPAFSCETDVTLISSTFCFVLSEVAGSCGAVSTFSSSSLNFHATIIFFSI